MPPSRVLLRLGSHAEKDYLLKTVGLFDGVVLGANLLEMTPGATVSLAWHFLELNKQFVIDPLTYVYALHPDFISSEKFNKKTKKIEKGMKASFQSMCKEFGGPFHQKSLTEAASLDPSDFETAASIDGLVRCVINYQLTRMKRICENDAQLKDFANSASPTLVFAPYFFIPGDDEKDSLAWESVNVRICEALGRVDVPVPKHAVLCFSRRILKDRARIMALFQTIANTGCDACWYWINNLKEEDITESELDNLILILRTMSDRGFPLHNLHGGFLSAMLNKFGLEAFSHSIGYGESKDVFPVSGGALPTVSYHYLPLHVKSSVPDIERAFSTLGISDARAFHKHVCDCSICVGTLKGNLSNFRKFGELTLKPGNQKESQTAESAKRCRFHFLLARKKELDLVNRLDRPALKMFLGASIDEYGLLPFSMRLRERSYALKLWTSRL